MGIVGQRERVTQKRILKLFTDLLGYRNEGSWELRTNNGNVEEAYLRRYLLRCGVRKELAERAIAELKKTAGDQAHGLYDANKEVYGLLRYGVPVKPDVGENVQTVRLIDWEHPLDNDFYVAEEVTGARQAHEAPRHRALCQRHRPGRDRS